MNKAHLLAGALAAGFTALLGGALQDPTALAQEGPAWLNSFPAAEAAARASGKPIFLVFR